MSEISELRQQVALLTQRLNYITVQARKIPELPDQNPLVSDSLIHVSESGFSKYISVQQILDAIFSIRQNQLVYIGTITVSGNDLNVPANAQWIINNIDYSNLADIVINVPYAVTGNTRTDIIVADTSNNMYRVNGPETAGISPAPNVPLNTVLVTTVNVTDSTIGYEPPVVGGDTEQLDFRMNGTDNFIDIGTTKKVVSLFYESALQEKTWWSQSGSLVTFTFSSPPPNNTLIQFIVQ